MAGKVCPAGTPSVTSQLDINRELEQMLKTATKAKKLFIVDGTKVAVIFNPNPNEGTRFGHFERFTTHFTLVANTKTVPHQVFQKIKAEIPKTYSCGDLVITDVINGPKIFEFLGLE